MSPVGVASTAGFCLGSFHARLPPIHGHIRTQCLRMEWTMDTPRPQTREHKNLWQMCTKKTWFGLEDDTCQSGMLTALAARAGRLLSRDTSNSLESPQHLQNTINATISFLPSMLSFKVKCINQFLLQLSVNFHHCYFIKYPRTPHSCFIILKKNSYSVINGWHIVGKHNSCNIALLQQLNINHTALLRLKNISLI